MLNPAIIALLLISVLLSFFALYSSNIGIQIIKHWDINSGSAKQITLERKTYLISTLLSYLMAIEFISFFLFIYTTDDIHRLFVGAMCAAGTLNINIYGYPSLILKLINLMLCGIWLNLNYVDNRGYDFPIIKEKYKILTGITVLLVLESVLLILYFSLLNADIITSCCGALFSEGTVSIIGNIAGFPSRAGKVMLFISFLTTISLGSYFLYAHKGGSLFAGINLWFFVFSIIAVMSFISVHYYELPTHHCPFCILQRDYLFVGYPLYISLIFAGIMGISVGILNLFKNKPTIAGLIFKTQRKLCVGSMISSTIFISIAVYPILFSEFKLEGY